MAKKLDEDLTVNDGNGLMDNIGMIESLMVDCNDIVQMIVSGRYVAFCGKIPEMVRKLALLKQGVKNDTEALHEQINELRKAGEANELEH